MNKIYFVHPVNVYNEPIEAAFEELIAYYLTNNFKDLIENPNQPHHQRGYAEKGGMKYFYNDVLPDCMGAVALPFLDRRIGLGVAGEIKWFFERQKPVWVIEPNNLGITPTLITLKTFINKPLCGLFMINPMQREDLIKIKYDDPRIVVPHEETRLRTWIVYGKIKRPYETAHLVKLPVPEDFYPNKV